MSESGDTLELRYVGHRFTGGRIPLDVLPDLSAMRDLVIAIAKARWLKEHGDRQRLPRGFNRSLSFDLIAINDGSARPLLQWDRMAARQNASADLVDEIGALLAASYSDAANLFNTSSVGRFPQTLPADQLAAVNRFGIALRNGEKVEFVNQNDASGHVITLDAEKRRTLLTQSGKDYSKLYSSSGVLHTVSASGYIEVSTTEYNLLRIDMEPELVPEFFDGNIGSEVQFELLLLMDRHDQLKRVERCIDATIVEASDSPTYISAMSRLTELKKVSAGWLDGAGEEVSAKSALAARALLRRKPGMTDLSLNIFPTEAGGLTLEFVSAGWDYTVEIASQGSLELFGIEIDGEGELEPMAFSTTDDDFWAVLQSRIGQ